MGKDFLINEKKQELYTIIFCNKIKIVGYDVITEKCECKSN